MVKEYNNRINYVFEKAYGRQPDYCSDRDLLAIDALHYILSSKKVYLSVNDFVHPKYTFVPNVNGDIFSNELHKDIFYDDLKSSTVSFSKNELETVDALVDSINKNSYSNIGATPEKIAQAMAKYIYVRDTHFLKIDKDIEDSFASLNSNSKIYFNVAKKAVKQFESTLKQHQEEAKLRTLQEEPVL